MFEDAIGLEMDLARIMSMQEAAGFPLDLETAKSVETHLMHRFEQLKAGMIKRFPSMKGKLKLPKAKSRVRSTHVGCPFHELVPFNPTSRQHIAHALKTLGVTFDKKTDSGQIKIDEDVLLEIVENTNNSVPARKAARRFARLLKLQKWLGQLSQGANAWIKKIEDDGCIHHSCTLATQTGRNAHRGPNLGQVVSAPWARKLFKPHTGHVLVGVDLEGLELRCLGHYLAPYDNGSFAEVVVNGDIHQQNADRVGCTRKQVKGLTYAFIYGAGLQKLGKLLYPTLSETSQSSKGKLLRQKFLDAIPGLEPLIEAVKKKVRVAGHLDALDGRPIICTAEHASLNYLLQSSGAIISKRWVVTAFNNLTAQFEWGKDFTFCAYVHDELQISARPEIAEQVKEIVEASALQAGEYYKFRVPTSAHGEIGKNWQETH